MGYGGESQMPDSSADSKSSKWWGANVYPEQGRDTVRVCRFRKMNLARRWKDQLGSEATT